MKQLNQKEEQVMQILWQLGRAFVKEIVAEFDDPKPPTTTISSIIRKLEKEGVVGFEAFGKTYRYYPILKKEAYGKQSFKKMMQQYFSGSPEKLLSHFMEETKMDDGELNRLLQQIKQQDD